MRPEGEPRFDPEQQVSEERSQARLQAQAESFADSGVEEFSEDQTKLLKYSAELSKIRDLNDLPADLPAELRDLVQKHKYRYINFLRRQGRLETSFVEKNIENYREHFQPAIAALKDKMAQGDPEQLPEYLGSGSNGSAFRIETDGKAYAAKFSGSLTQANFEIKPLLRAKGIPHVAQLESYSFEDGVVVMDLLPGKEVSQFTPETAPEYTDAHIIQLIDTVRELDAKGLVIDPKPSNFMYDPTEGFSVLDFHLKKNISSNYDLPQEIIDLKAALSARKFENLDYKAADYQEKVRERTLESYKIYLPMMIRFLGILKDKYPDILSKWQERHERDKKDPRMYVSELIPRKDIPEHPDLEPYLKKLEEMGF
jgi:hypothetical protein